MIRTLLYIVFWAIALACISTYGMIFFLIGLVVCGMMTTALDAEGFFDI